MMTPKEKAKELIEKYLKLNIEIGGQYDGYLTMKMHDVKQCALIAVDEMFNETDTVYPSLRKLYWRNVKLEIEKL